MTFILDDFKAHSVFAAWLGSISIISGCAFSPINPRSNDLVSADPEVAACFATYWQDDDLILRMGVRDVQDHLIAGYPFLRTSRLTASLADRVHYPETRAMWIDRLSALDEEARTIEHLNLPDSRSSLVASSTELKRCRTVMKNFVLADETAFGQVVERAVVPDRYRSWTRGLGFYPLSSWFVLQGVKRLHARESGSFMMPPDPNCCDATQKYSLHPTVTNSPSAHDRTDFELDRLGIPVISEALLAVLLIRHSPIWSIDTQSDNDRIGTVMHDGSEAFVSVDRSSIYTQLTYTIFGGEVLAQLNYTIWFARRPRQGLFDILGGRIDGITWRVTLDQSGEPLIADAMHNCGCYYMAFPTARLASQTQVPRFEEPLWIPKNLPRIDDARLQISISSNAHYIKSVERVVDSGTSKHLSHVTYNQLRSLPSTDGKNASMFNQNGLVKNTERAERWLLWPMGVISAGAMRQQGHHPIAFVGRRHFDDPDLLDRYFARRTLPEQ
ncbi:MAG: hypothetical protein O3C28_10670 [Proteobacteria bacterium]|nr:hypothetical protein [Pseudomonadota bacterium]